MVCSVPAALIAGVIAFVVWVISEAYPVQLPDGRRVLGRTWGWGSLLKLS